MDVAGSRAVLRACSAAAGGSGDVGEDAVQLVEAVVAHHQPAPAPRGVLDGHLGTELVGQLLLEALHIRVPVPGRVSRGFAGGRRADLQASDQTFCIPYLERPLDDDGGDLDLLPAVGEPKQSASVPHFQLTPLQHFADLGGKLE
jgi:hypothetical protein